MEYTGDKKQLDWKTIIIIILILIICYFIFWSGGSPPSESEGAGFTPTIGESLKNFLSNFSFSEINICNGHMVCRFGIISVSLLTMIAILRIFVRR